MFTGLVQTKGKVESKERSMGLVNLEIKIDPQVNWSLVSGESIALNGACLTVSQIREKSVLFQVGKESLDLTNLSLLNQGDSVNLERAMLATERLGGHLVTGHVDGLGLISKRDQIGDCLNLTVQIPKELSRYIIMKGSVCLDGVSLTVNNLKDLADYSEIQVLLIPTTLKETTLVSCPVGWKINVEVDQIAKYIERFRLVSSRESDFDS